MAQGLIHIYTGDGKGKTTAAFGLGMRAAGCGLRVSVFQFLKNTSSGELMSAARLPDFRVVRAETDVTGFLWELGKADASRLGLANAQLFGAATAEANDCDLLILDEIFAAVSCGFVPEERLLAFLRGKPEALEVVLTGRDAPQAVQDEADYVTQLCCIRHPMDAGVPARRGIEF